eukprot:1194771-Prorocentrum_minimum.AAC.11
MTAPSAPFFGLWGVQPPPPSTPFRSLGRPQIGRKLAANAAPPRASPEFPVNYYLVAIRDVVLTRDVYSRGGRCTECGLPIHVDGLIMVQNYGRDQCHSQCVTHTEKCAVIHLGRIEVGHMPLIKNIFNIKRFVSQANRCAPGGCQQLTCGTY